MTPVLPRSAGARWAPALRTLGDERLARMAQSGSDAAFAAIYGRYAPVLHGYCRSLLHDEEEAADALQNTILKVMQAFARQGLTGPLRPWLFRIAHNESVSLIRARSRRPGELSEAVVAGGADAHRQAAAREDLSRLLADLDGLTAHQRGALVMRELGGLSYDDVASALETSPLAARQAVFSARRRLKAAHDFSVLLPVAPVSATAFLAAVATTAGGGTAAAGGGLLSGLAGSTAGKTVAGLLATATVGVGSVEVVTHAPGTGGNRDRPAARVAEAPAAKAAAAPSPTATAQAITLRPAAATATPGASPAPATERSAAAKDRRRATTQRRRAASRPAEERTDDRPRDDDTADRPSWTPGDGWDGSRPTRWRSETTPTTDSWNRWTGDGTRGTRPDGADRPWGGRPARTQAPAATSTPAPATTPEPTTTAAPTATASATPSATATPVTEAAEDEVTDAVGSGGT